MITFYWFIWTKSNELFTFYFFYIFKMLNMKIKKTILTDLILIWTKRIITLVNSWYFMDLTKNYLSISNYFFWMISMKVYKTITTKIFIITALLAFTSKVSFFIMVRTYMNNLFFIFFSLSILIKIILNSNTLLTHDFKWN
jgi:hypothetical protein